MANGLNALSFIASEWSKECVFDFGWWGWSRKSNEDGYHPCQSDCFPFLVEREGPRYFFIEKEIPIPQNTSPAQSPANPSIGRVEDSSFVQKESL